MSSKRVERARQRQARTAGPKPSTNGHAAAPPPDKGDAWDAQPLKKEEEKPARAPIAKFSAGKLIEEYPSLRPAVIDGLVREGECLNIVSLSKFGKTWLTLGLALSIATERPWLGRFQTSRGRVLLIDNELHRETIASRLKTVTSAMGIELKEYANEIEVWPLRGNLRDIYTIGEDLALVKPGDFKMIVFDAKYRMAAPGSSENDNAGDAQFYNQLDYYADRTRAVMTSIHHASKGNQADKRVTDVGAGAGAQSRAADVHLILREHEDDSVAVFDAALRSFAPVTPFSLRWAFPLWTPEDAADPTKLRGRLTLQQQRKRERDQDGVTKVTEALQKGPTTERRLRTLTGIGPDRLKRLLAELIEAKRVESIESIVGGNVCDEYRLRDG